VAPRPTPTHALWLAGLLLSCEVAFPLDGYEGTAQNDAGPDAVVPSDASASPDGDALVPPGDAPAEAPDGADGANASDAPPDAPGDPCARFTRGPKMVRAGAICIDATEVTQAQYQAFLTAMAGDVSGQIAQCTWNSEWTPGGSLGCTFDPTGHATYPMIGVDWCDAWAFCAWAGKRLCGRVGGSGVPSADAGTIDDPAQSERTAVCTKGGLHRFPYGDTFDPNACNGGEHTGTRETVPVATTPGCQGGYAGVFDMAGNVHEWENACDTTTAGNEGMNDNCAFRGGSYHDTPEDSCFTDFAWARIMADCDLGIRCCADP
jgi:formylglycine-generating enzyme required for sulfatase activity